MSTARFHWGSSIWTSVRMSFRWCWGLRALTAAGNFPKELSATLFLPMKWPNKHKAQLSKHNIFKQKKTCTAIFLKLQRRIIVSLTTCPQIPPGIHLDLWNFISQLSQIKTHRGIHGNKGEEDERDESCSAELYEDASHSSKRLAHDQMIPNWSFDPRCLPGDGGIYRGWTWEANGTDVIHRLLIGRTVHIRSIHLTAGLQPSDTCLGSVTQIDFCSVLKRFFFWVILLYHLGTCNNNKKTDQIWFNAPIYLWEGKHDSKARGPLHAEQMERFRMCWGPGVHW